MLYIHISGYDLKRSGTSVDGSVVVPSDETLCIHLCLNTLATFITERDLSSYDQNIALILAAYVLASEDNAGLVQLVRLLFYTQLIIVSPVSLIQSNNIIFKDRFRLWITVLTISSSVFQRIS